MEVRKPRSEEVIDLIYNWFWQAIRGFEGEVGDGIPFITLLITENTINFAVESATLFF